MAMNAFERHKRLINDYVRYYSKEKSFDAIFKRDTWVSYDLFTYKYFFYFINLSSNDKTDIDIIRNEHRFLWDEEEDVPNETW